MANRGIKGILFTGWKIRAIMNGADVTRRRMNPQPPDKPRHAKVEDQWVWYELGFDGDHYPPEDCRKPRYHKGDILYVKEAWRTFEIYDNLKPSELLGRIPTPSISYMTRPASPSIHWGRYRHARFMCKWMSRLWLRVTEEPRPERVLRISEAEAVREGVERFTGAHDIQGWKPYYKGNLDVLQFASNSYYTLWDSIHGRGAHLDDWVWRIPFERTEAPDV